jgi:predicted permease
LVNESFARRFWPGQDPLGKRLSVSGPRGNLLEVVGVTRDGKYNTLGEAPTPFFYLPLWQDLQGAMTLMVRTANDPRGSLATVRGVFRELDRNLPVTDVKTMVEHLGFSLFPARMAATLLGAFGLLALLLAAIGLYGVMAYSVSMRTREIGVRMALGASRRDVLLLVARQGMTLTLAGIVIGLGAAFALTRLLGSLLYGLSATDPATFVGISILLGGIALFAGFIPARRATRIDPMTALRYE